MIRFVCALFLAAAAVGCSDSAAPTSEPKLAAGSKVDPALQPAGASGAVKSEAKGTQAVKGD